MSDKLPPLLVSLLRPEAFAHPVRDVTLVETHISWVILTGEFAYKIKRPVQYAFVDLRDVERRAYFCHEEIRLGRRFAPDLYLDVCDVTAQGETARIGGEGTVVEHAVRMRQFARDDELDRLLLAGRIEPEELGRFGRSLSRIHSRLPSPVDGQRLGRAEAAAQIMRANLAECIDAAKPCGVGEELAALREPLEERLALLEPLMARRFEQGRVRECHGDLHTGNVTRYSGKLVAFDSIEFEPAFRWIDVADEVSFLLVDLRRMGKPEHGRAFVDGYLGESGDYQACRLLSLYEAHRGLVRAKIAALKAGAKDDELERRPHIAELRAFVGCAENALASRRPRLVATTGLSGSGKTVLARRLAAALGAVHVRSDVERKRLAGLAELEASRSGLAEGVYGAEMTERVYERLMACAHDALSGGWSVVVDGTFLQRADRQKLAQLAERHGIAAELVRCSAPRDVLLERIARRAAEGGDASEADASVLGLQEARAESVTPDEGFRSLDVDTSNDAALDRALSELERRP
jgi:aminoglycoside phosphotransferase family enzyme/predicted kinase